jgi:rRNA maturation RNase YbeY
MWTERKLQNLAARILKLLKLRGATLDIFLLPHAEMKALKARFKMKKTEPNVLSFRATDDFPHPEEKKKYLGEIYLNRDILRKSPERAVPLLLHGVLHLLGHDHEKKKDATKMEKIERAIMEKLAFRSRGE